MRNYESETKQRVAFIQNLLAQSHTQGVIFGLSGGKDSALVGILSKLATPNVHGVIMPCESKRNYEEDTVDAIALATQYNIEYSTVDLTAAKKSLLASIAQDIPLAANTNIAPRLRMTTLYALAQTRNYLVAGTGNRSEVYMGYFTKWGDGACDFNPISDLTVTEIYEFLQYLKAPAVFWTKAPSAGLFEGQTDEKEMGITYKELDNYLLNGTAPAAIEKIEKAHAITEHKRVPIKKFNDNF